jgi:tRNA-2-methylthio-N6-dimethylallyladenosine synthase
MTSKKVFIKTFGCQMNEHDSSRMADTLYHAEGLEPTQNIEEADVILLNTCSIREKSEEKVFSHLGVLAPLKEKNQDLIIGVGGCVASQEGSKIVKRAPYVDIVFGPQTLHRLPDLIQQYRHTKQSQVDISFPEIEKFDLLPPPKVEGATAFLSIMEGCSKYCSFCVVPYTRGEEYSRPFEDILTEAAYLASHGVKEITLIGQTVNAYRGKTKDGDHADLALIIEYLAQIPEIERIRFTTSHPKDMSDRLIDCFRTIPKLVSHIHLPVQSGSDQILMAMKRNHTVLEYKSTIRKLRQARPDISITSDFIVGFPGETERDFEATMKLIHDVGYDFSYSFLYSPRPGTPASYLSDETPDSVKQSRLSKLQAINDAQGKVLSDQMVGTIQRVLVEGVSKRDEQELHGKTDNNRTVNFPGNPEWMHQFIDVLITESMTYTLRGERVT